MVGLIVSMTKVGLVLRQSPVVRRGLKMGKKKDKDDKKKKGGCK
jgi:hypothetical protein